MEQLNVILIGVLILAGIGFYGLLALRNLFKVIMALQMLVKAAILALVAAGIASGQPALGQSLAVTVIAVDTIVAAVGLALAIQVKRRYNTLDLRALAQLNG